tara:strand:+ start:1401 stop:2027 length:627 start_codon:yes stop_codon:yes gene_type:complete
MTNFLTIDNFLDKKDMMQLIKSINKSRVEGIQVFHNSIDKNLNIFESSLKKEFIKKLQRKYLPKAIEILGKINPKKLDLYDYSDFTLIITNKNKKFPIHDDTPDKILSGVIYLYPQKNKGTIFYNNKKGDKKKIVKWKQNRAVFFSRIEKKSWHSYEGDGISDRITLVFNLKTYRIKRVYKIENKSFIFGILRWKLNPFIHRIFGKII